MRNIWRRGGGEGGARCTSRAPSLQCRSGSFMSLCGRQAVQSDGICSVLRNASTLLEHEAQVELSVQETALAAALSASQICATEHAHRLREVFIFSIGRRCSAEQKPALVTVAALLLRGQGRGRTAAADGLHNGNFERCIAGGPKQLPSLQNIEQVNAVQSPCTITCGVCSLNAQCEPSVSIAQSSTLQPFSSITCSSPGARE